MNHIPELILSCVIAYLLGSVSSGILVSKAVNGPDLHTVGSKSTGASNVQRTLGWKYGLIVFFADVLKGVLACLIAELLTGDHLAALPAGLCCVIGHNWPVGLCSFSSKAAKALPRPAALCCTAFPFGR